MTILVGREIAKSIHNCRPNRVAVAFLGADWRKYIRDPKLLEYVVISPGLGTNPYAVIDLTKTIGWDKVYLLDGLHAKVYLGPGLAVVGSANLTSNGLSGTRLIELCVPVCDKTELEALLACLDNWRSMAAARYPDVASKKSRLAKLKKDWERASVEGLIKTPSPKTTAFKDFQLLRSNDFYVVWYTNDIDIAHEDKLVPLESEIENEMHFTPDDPVQKGNWLLTWRKTNGGTCDGRNHPQWMYVHDVFNNGIVNPDYEYPKCAIQWMGRPIPPVPFELTPDVIAAFRAVIDRDRFWAFKQRRSKVYSVKKSIPRLPALLQAMREFKAS